MLNRHHDLSFLEGRELLKADEARALSRARIWLFKHVLVCVLVAEPHSFGVLVGAIESEYGAFTFLVSSCGQ